MKNRKIVVAFFIIIDLHLYKYIFFSQFMYKLEIFYRYTKPTLFRNKIHRFFIEQLAK
jgi:hypothetical protein